MAERRRIEVFCSPELVAELQKTDGELSALAGKLELEAQRAGRLMARWVAGAAVVLAMVGFAPEWVPGRLVVGAVSVVAALVATQVLFLDRWSSAAGARSIRRAFQARSQVVRDALAGRVFGLYLRDYDPERRKSVHVGPAGTMPVDEVDPIERSLNRTVGRRVPLYALLNKNERFGSGVITRVAATSDWSKNVETLAGQALIVVLSVDALTPSLFLEVDILEKCRLLDRVFVTATRPAWDQLQRQRPAFMAQVKWKALRGTRSGPLIAGGRGTDAGATLELLESLRSQTARAREILITWDAPLDEGTAHAILMHQLGLIRIPAGTEPVEIRVALRDDRLGSRSGLGTKV